MSNDEIPLTAEKRAALEKMIATLNAYVDGSGDLLDINEACIAMEELWDLIGAKHPTVHRLRRELEKCGLRRPSSANGDLK